MQSGAISDGQISASSHDNNKQPWKGRLNKPGALSVWSAAASSKNNQWLQIDLLSYYTIVSRVATQGRNDYKQWVTEYHLKYSNDGVTFHYYRERGQSTNKVRLTSNWRA